MSLLDILNPASWVASAVTAIGGKVADTVLGYHKDSLDAGNQADRIRADLAKQQIDLDKREAEINASVVIAEQGNFITRCIRPLLALPVIILVWKLLVWDKALGQWTHGSTDSLSDQIWWYCTTVTIAYFGGRTVENVATKIVGVFKK